MCRLVSRELHPQRHCVHRQRHWNADRVTYHVADGTCISASLYSYPNCTFNQTQKTRMLTGPYASSRPECVVAG
jgi:hypothetical protein